jgi:hypothetical protein
VDTSQRTISWSTRERSERQRPNEGDRVVPLDAWSCHPWTDGVQVDELPAFETIQVKTRNTVYSSWWTAATARSS